MRLLLAAVVIPSLLLGLRCALAEVKPAAIFSDNMVLQRGIAVPVWGTAAPGEKVIVKLAAQEKAAAADKNGEWKVKLDPLEAGGPFEMTIAGQQNTVALKNVLVGEVWFCSGQSNMAFGLASADNAADATAKANYPNIRLFSWDAEWKVCSPETAKNFSAVGYFFGRDLHEALKVPVGLIVRGIGGTPAEAWTSRSAFEADPYLRKNILEPWEKSVAEYPEKLKAWEAAPADKKPPKPIGPGFGGDPGTLFDKHVAPVIPYAIRGAVWYQGESNAWGFPIAEQYCKMLPTLIQDWRKQWGQGDFPFLVVQLPNGPAQDTPRPLEPSPWQFVQEAQARAAQLPNVGVGVTIDLGEADIHPKRKEPVGQRLALLARAMVYGDKIVHSGPTLDRMEREGNKARLSFKNVGGGLAAQGGGALKGFAIAGEDRYFVWANASIEGDTVLVWSNDVPTPAAVRYAFFEATPANLYNKEGLPAGPFRTDDWSWDTPVKQARAARCIKVTKPPKVDGKLDDETWAKCDVLTDFTVTYTHRKSAFPTEARLCYDDKNLYVAFVCKEPDMHRVVANVQARDDKKIWSDDYVELMLDVKRDKRNYYRFTFNAGGHVADAKAFNDAADGVKWLNQNLLADDRALDLSWNWEGGGTVAASRDGGAWALEAEIPWKAFGMDAPKPGTAMGLLLTRGHADPEEDSEWIVTGRDRNTGAMLPPQYCGGCTTYHSPMRFGELTFE